MWNAITLDGYFEGPHFWDLDWHNEVWGDELERFSIEQLDSADALVFGRVTYEGMAAYWSTASGEVAERMNAIAKIVYSRTLEAAEWTNTTLIKELDVDEMRRFKAEGDGAALVVGSGVLSAALLEADLFDEYRLLVAPVILGAGTPLFGRGLPHRRLELLEALPLRSGAVILRYAAAPAKDG
jgi:dihydrofolate reductase